jgi:phosphatidylinositol alpha 1,6-mannosyltransferase
VRVAIVAECFLPSVNGVTQSVLRTVEHLRVRGHQPVVIAPSPGPGGGGQQAIEATVPAPVVWLPAVGLPGYRSFRVSPVGVGRVRSLLAEIDPDVVHLASPFVLGWDAVRAAQLLGRPTVAVYQTEVPTYAARYGFGGLEPLLWRRVCDLHGRADRTLAPSRSACARLRERGVPEVHDWARGVDLDRFSPARRTAQRRSDFGGPGSVVVGYVGRLAAEKQLENLAVLRSVDGVRLVVIGDGPLRARLERLLPDAVFLGWQGGTDLATSMASFDVGVHPGEHETFGQAVQEKLASGVPVVAVAAGGMLDLVRDGVNGRLYPPGDLRALRDQVAELAADPRLRQRMGTAARESVRDRGWDRFGDQLIGHYEAVRRLRAPVAA